MQQATAEGLEEMLQKTDREQMKNRETNHRAPPIANGTEG